MFIIVSRILLPKGAVGLTLFPFILVSKKSYLDDKVLVNHEKIHIKQQMELLILPFYFWYLIDFGIQYLKYKNKHEAYRNIIFEKEAYKHEKDVDYLKTRKIFGFLR